MMRTKARVGQKDNSKPPTRISGGGVLVVGVAGRGTDQAVNGFGLVFQGQEEFDADAPPIEDIVIAGGGQQLFKERAPKGGVLIGLEIGLGKFFGEDVIKAVRPTYRVNGNEQFGVQRGQMPGTPKTIKAKEGDAVGAIACKSGLNFDGCSLTFMKIKEGRLDPNDSYESEWVGWNGNKRPRRITGDAKPAVGIAGRGSDRELNGLGLLFQN